MPPADVPSPRTRQEIIDDLGLYPAEAFDFVERGLSYTVDRMHGGGAEGETRHVSGQELCHGLRDYALIQWGMLARTVLARWNITTTLDFGRIVYAMVEGGLMHKREEDSLDDFRNVYDFATAFDAAYKIECRT
jgi:uncharacterized repeat protein (TIGR04138 family)